MGGGTKVLLVCSLVIGFGHAQRFFPSGATLVSSRSGGVPFGASQVGSRTFGSSLVSKPSAVDTVSRPVTVDAATEKSVPVFVDQTTSSPKENKRDSIRSQYSSIINQSPGRSRSEALDSLLDDAVRSLTGDSSERGSGRGAPSRLPRINLPARNKAPSTEAPVTTSTTTTPRANPSEGFRGSAGLKERIQSFNRARAGHNSRDRNPSSTIESARSSPITTGSLQESPSTQDVRPISTPDIRPISTPNIRPISTPNIRPISSPDVRPIQTQRQTVSAPEARINSRQSSRFSPSSEESVPVQSQFPNTVQPEAQKSPTFGSSRGNARVFDPTTNPINERKRPRIQQFRDLAPTEEESERNVEPLTNDFLPSCPDATFSYIIPSPTQCDLYYLCEFGTPSKQVCDDGLVFSIDQVKCVSSALEDCEDRPLLQTPQGTGACTRKNGIFYSNDTCSDFVTCRDNKASFERCAEGLVYDPKQKICAWADEALRPGCLPEDLLGFKCPNPKLTQQQALENRIQLRFGDHDRHPDPEDCRFFYMCLTTGQPRRAGCGRGKVFDRTTGICKNAKDVPECFDYYGSGGNSGATSAADGASSKTDARILKIQQDISRQFSRPSQLLTRNRRELSEHAEPEGF